MLRVRVYDQDVFNIIRRYFRRRRQFMLDISAIRASTDQLNANLATLNTAIASAVTALQNANPGITQHDLDGLASSISAAATIAQTAASTLAAATPT